MPIVIDQKWQTKFTVSIFRFRKDQFRQTEMKGVQMDVQIKVHFAESTKKEEKKSARTDHQGGDGPKVGGIVITDSDLKGLRIFRHHKEKRWFNIHIRHLSPAL